MKISYKGDYALKALLELAISYDEQNEAVLPIVALAKRLDIPQKFLEAILLNLKKGGFVKSKRGKEGGYTLASHPAKVTVGDIVRFVEGPIEPIACCDDYYKGCRDLDTCTLRSVWKKTAEAISSVVDHITLEQLVRETLTRRKAPDFCI
ncbi:MAG TPA: Rrf2 family transcriptional regulator [Dissulfurispiraceae bacterium]|nr:Rrf2 family transcriptional regulator [Dissulfurispiraceae bacterium]